MALAEAEPSRRRVHGWLLGLAIAAAIAAAAMSGPEAAAAQPPPFPGGFELDGSNGYSVLVWGVPPRRGRPAEVLLVVRGHAAEVTYFAPAEVTETSIQASLGKLGEIDVSFRPSGQATREKSACDDRPVAFDSGFYEGVIEFDGEEGYTQVTATRAKGGIQFVLNVLCPNLGGPSGSGPGVPGAELRVRQRTSGGALTFDAHKNRSGARAFFEASVFERRGEIAIERLTTAKARSAAFEYDPLLQTAMVKPPAPFSGLATFHRKAAISNQWTGSLSVDFPGRSSVSLTSGAPRATIIRAEWDNSRH